MGTNNINTSNFEPGDIAPPHADTDSSGAPRGANLTDLGHTGPKTGEESLTPGNQHTEMSQHEIRPRTEETAPE